MANRKVALPFRPRARVLQLLGDELIGNARLAVFELVKNAYDADASQVIVRLETRPNHTPLIRISDDGVGMSLETIRSVWLVPGNDHRQRQRFTSTPQGDRNRQEVGRRQRDDYSKRTSCTSSQPARLIG